jgi:hypothetical protein
MDYGAGLWGNFGREKTTGVAWPWLVNLGGRVERKVFGVENSPGCGVVTGELLVSAKSDNEKVTLFLLLKK